MAFVHGAHIGGNVICNQPPAPESANTVFETLGYNEAAIRRIAGDVALLADRICGAVPKDCSECKPPHPDSVYAALLDQKGALESIQYDLDRIHKTLGSM